MTRRRCILAWGLLVVFAAGGIVGPVAHRIQHGAERLAASADEPCHPPAVHRADGALWTGEATDLDAPDCDLCARRLLVVPPVLAPPTSPRVVGTTQVEGYSHVAPAPVVRTLLIRGPPRHTGFRLG